MVESVPAMSSVEKLLCALRRTPAKGGAGPSAIIDRVQEWKGLGESMVKSLADYLSDIESREEKLRVVGESLETRLKDLKEEERELKLLQEGKGEALKYMEEKLKSREEKLDEQLKSVDQHIESLEASHGEVECLRKKEREKLKEIEKRERELDAVRGLLEKRLGEFEKREKEFDRKSRELSLKEEDLVKEKKEFAEEIRLTYEKLQEKQKRGCGLITRLELALNMLHKMKGFMDERFKEVESREATAHESLTARLNEADLIRESLEKRFREIEDAEKGLKSKEQSSEKRLREIEKELKSKEQSSEKRFREIEDAEKELKSKEQSLEKRFREIEDAEKELKSKEQQLGNMRIDEAELRVEKSSEQQKLGNMSEGKKPETELKQLNLVSCKTEPDYEEHGTREKSLSSVREFELTCVKENLAPSKLDQRQKQSVVEGMLQGSKQPMLTATTEAPRDTSVVLRDALQEDHKRLEMLINYHEKDMKLMGDEIRKLLALSSEPARLVVEAVEGFYALHSGKLDTGCKEGRAAFLMLGQLTILSPKIEPCVEEAAFKLALQWKSKMGSTPTKALAFLHLVAAYNLSSNFDKNELFDILKQAAKHRQTPDLCRSLGLEEKIPGYIHKLINEKKNLVASTYIHAYQLQNMFSQRAILNHYVTNAKCSAKARLRGARNPSEAKEKAIASEIAALHTVIDHIIKYELQSAYSPNALTAKIRQLKANRDNLRRVIPSSPANIQDEGKGRFWKENKKAKFNKGKRRFNREPATNVLDHQVAPCHGSNSWSSLAPPPPPALAPAWRPQHEVSHTETQPVGPPHPWVPVNMAPMPHHPVVRPFKRGRPNTWMNEGGFQQGQFANSQ